MSDTPRTDDHAFQLPHVGGAEEIVSADFARTLERELAAVTKERDKATSARMLLEIKHTATVNERDQWKQLSDGYQTEAHRLNAALAEAEKELKTARNPQPQPEQAK